MSGRLEVICGSMFSGKSQELMRRLKRADIAQLNVLTFKHEIDQRGGPCTAIVSHDGKSREAHSFHENSMEVGHLFNYVTDDVDVVGLDELQFFPDSILRFIQTLVSQMGKRVIVAGLDMDFRGQIFPLTAAAMAMADEVMKLRAICISCGRDANYSQLLSHGRPVHSLDAAFHVGGAECYEARCRTCFVSPETAEQHSYSLSLLR